MSDASQAARGARAEAWRRAYAMIIDIGVVSAAVSFIGPLLFNPTDARTRVLFVLAHYLLPALYLLLLEWRFGVTLGKRAFAIRVQAPGGGPISFKQALKRVAIRLIPLISLVAIALMLMPPAPLWSGYFLAIGLVGVAAIIVSLVNLFITADRGNRPWHDRWAGTEVVETGPPPVWWLPSRRRVRP